MSPSITDDFITAFVDIESRKRIFATSCLMKSSCDMCIDDFLEDSLTYSPLKEIQNQENSPALFFKTLDRAKKSPSTARLFALLGGGNLELRSSGGTPGGSKPVARRLEDFLNTPERSPDESCGSKTAADLSLEVASLQASLATIQEDCEFHRKRAAHAQDELNGLTKYVTLLEEERRVTRKSAPLIDSDETRRLSVLNTSLAKQNDLLRSRSSVTSRFSKRDWAIQTDRTRLIDAATDTISPSDDSPVAVSHASPQHISFMGTPSCIGANERTAGRPRDSECQTVSGVWATVEEMDRPGHPPTARPSLPIRNKRASSTNGRKSQPNEYLFLSRNDWRPLAAVKRRGKSVGASNRPPNLSARPKWIP